MIETRRDAWLLGTLVVLLLGLGGCGSDPDSPDDIINRNPAPGPFDCTVRVGATSVMHAAPVVAPAGQCGVELTTGSTSIDDAYGVAFHLTYPTILLFEMAVDTGALSPDAAQTELNITDVGNEVVVGYTRVGPVGGVTLAPGTALFRVFFRAENVGVGPLDLTGNELRDSQGLTISPPPDWLGATVEVILAP